MPTAWNSARPSAVVMSRAVHRYQRNEPSGLRITPDAPAAGPDAPCATGRSATPSARGMSGMNPSTDRPTSAPRGWPNKRQSVSLTNVRVPSAVYRTMAAGVPSTSAWYSAAEAASAASARSRSARVVVIASTISVAVAAIAHSISIMVIGGR